MLQKTSEKGMVCMWSAMSVLAHVSFLLKAAGCNRITICLYKRYAELSVYVDTVGDSLVVETILLDNVDKSWTYERRKSSTIAGDEFYCLSLRNESLYDGAAE